MSDAEYQSAQEDAPPSTQPPPKTQAPQPAQSESKMKTRKASKASLPTIEEEDVKDKPVPSTVTTRVKKGTKTSKPAAAAEPKKTPACDKCRRSKIRCSHRREISADGQVSPESVGSPAKTRKRKATSVPAEEKQNKDKGKEPASEAAEPVAAPKRSRGRPRKRLAEAANQDNHLTPAKRPKTDSKTPDQTEPVEISALPRPRKYPALANLEGSAELALHVVMERKLKEDLKFVDEKYDSCFKLISQSLEEHREGVERLREVETMMKGWQEAFARGE